MNSISRAVTSRFNDISHKRQRLVGESAKDSEIINPSWSDPSTSDFNYYEPPTLIIPEENCREECLTPILEKYKKHKSPSEKSPNKHISKKMTSVVRKLSPFGSNISLNKEAQIKESEEIETDADKKQKKFKETGSCSKI